MYCTQCGHEVTERANFCTECGCRIEMIETRIQPEEVKAQTEEVNADEKSQKVSYLWVWLVVILTIISIMAGIFAAFMPAPKPTADTFSTVTKKTDTSMQAEELLGGLIFGAGAFLVICFVHSVTRYSGSDDDYEEFSDEYLSKLANRAWDCSKYKSAVKYLEEIQGIENLAEHSDVSNRTMDNIRSRVEDIREHVQDLAEMEWEEKANSLIDEFEMYFYFVVDCIGEWTEIDSLSSKKAKCLRLYDKYFSPEFENHAGSSKYAYLKERLEDSYEPCMESRSELEKRLTLAINEMKPEVKRKKKFYSEMLDYIREKESILRAELLKHNFDGFTQEELKYVYKDLLAKYRIVEYKMGHAYFVTLSDKEKEKTSK